MININDIIKSKRETIKVPLKEMGHEIGKKQVYFWDKFLTDKLNAGQFDATDDVFIKSYDIVCPYCGKYLKLREIKPDYSGGMAKVPFMMYHTGNSYVFTCECGAYFSGQHKWMWID
jgi:hypothetical protein